MKKIQTLFVREYKDHKVVGITDKVTEGCERIFSAAPNGDNIFMTFPTKGGN